MRRVIDIFYYLIEATKIILCANAFIVNYHGDKSINFCVKGKSEPCNTLSTI